MLDAAERLRSCEAQAGFGGALLQCLQSENVGIHVKQAACIYFKNFVKRCWLAEPGGMTSADRGALKETIIPSIVLAPKLLRSQLCAALEEMAKADFPADWPNLVTELMRILASDGDVQVKTGAMEAAHEVFLPFRCQRDAERVREARSCAENFGPVHLEVWKMACENVVRRGDIPTEFLSGYIDLLMATTSVFYDLNAAALPNAFNDNRDAYIQGSLALLSYRNAGMPSSLSPLKCQICSNLTLYATRYEEAFQPCVSICVRAVWELLVAPEQNHELAAAGMIFLSAVARGTFNNPSPFAENTALQAIFDKVILPNLQVTQCDVELFRDDPREYTARNLEGADQDTCRRAAIDLVISLRKHHDARVGEIVVDYASKLLAQAEGAGLEREMLCKDACLSLVTALAGSRPSNLHARVLEGVFSAVVAPELTAEPAVERGLLCAACLKFVTVLRIHLPIACVMSVLPGIARHIIAESPVVHTYAAHCLSGLTTVCEPASASSQRKPRFDPQVLRPLVLQAIWPALQILLEQRGIVQNEHMAYALMRMLHFVDWSSSAATGAAAQSLRALTQIVSTTTGPLNPEFMHSIFNSIAIVLKGTAPAHLEEAESIVLPTVGQIWDQRVEDLIPYCLQITALLLDLTPADRIKAFYGEAFGRILEESLWRSAGSMPGLVRLLQAYLAKHRQFAALIHGHMQVIFERFKLVLEHRKLGSNAFAILNAIFRYLPPEFYHPYLRVALSLVLVRLEAKKDMILERECALSLLLFAHLHEDPETLPQLLQQVRPGSFQHLMAKALVPGACRCRTFQRRKVCISGTVKLMRSSEVLHNRDLLLACCEGLVRMMRRSNLVALSLLALVLSAKSEADVEEGEEFEVPFSCLEHAELNAGDLQPGLQDPLPEVQDMATGLAAARAALEPLQAQILALGEASKPLLEILHT